ncbi:hypothetical protein F5X99DRAFT_104904 [Biscogniauxia marginata]|nr:hypothetical protein F5X99DRAFT_104904 [Biscogniauxia marginata]
MAWNFSHDSTQEHVLRNALGLACKNANREAIETLLRLGANANGVTLPEAKESWTYCRPILDLLKQDISGPRDQCPWRYHTRNDILESSAGPQLDDDDVGQGIPLQLMKWQYPAHAGRVLTRCMDCYDVWNSPKLPESFSEIVDKRYAHWIEQIDNIGWRMVECARLLVAHGANTSFIPEDTQYAVEYFLLHTIWRFLCPVARDICHLSADESRPISELLDTLRERFEDTAFHSFGELCFVVPFTLPEFQEVQKRHERARQDKQGSSDSNEPEELPDHMPGWAMRDYRDDYGSALWGNSLRDDKPMGDDELRFSDSSSQVSDSVRSGDSSED